MQQLKRGCFLFLILIVSSLPAASGLAGNPPLVQVRERLNELETQSRESMHRVVQMAYMGYIGLPAQDLLPDQQLLGRPESWFSDLNRSLKQKVQPLIEEGVRLSELYWQRGGDRSYLDQFTIRQLRLQGLIFSNSEDYNNARISLEAAVSLAERGDDWKSYSYALNNLAYCNFHLGRTGEAIQNLQTAAGLAEKAADPVTQSLFLYNLGWAHLSAGSPRSAASTLERAVLFSQEADLPVREATSWINLASAYLLQGHLEKAEIAYRKGLQISDRINSLRYRTLGALNYAGLLTMQDKNTEAQDLLGQAQRLMEREGERVFSPAERLILDQRAQGESVPEKLGAGPAMMKAAASPTLHSHFAQMLPTPAIYAATEEAVSSVQAGPSGRVLLKMKPATTPPNTTFTMPVYLSVADGTELGMLEFESRMPKGALVLAKVEKGFLLQKGNFEIQSALESDEADPKNEKIKVSVRSLSKDGVAQALPSGLILYLSLTAPEKVKHNLVVLNNKVVSARTLQGKDLGPSAVAAEDQKVTILTDDVIPIVICFFYVH